MNLKQYQKQFLNIVRFGSKGRRPPPPPRYNTCTYDCLYYDVQSTMLYDSKYQLFISVTDAMLHAQQDASFLLW